jgi:hypothetical protein
MLAFLLLMSAAAPPAPLPPEEAAAGWIRLFDGESLSGWSAPAGVRWSAAGGVLKAANGPSGMLRTHAAFGDFRLKLEYRVHSPETRAAVALRVSPSPGYEIAIDDLGERFPTGSIAGRARAKAPFPTAGHWRALDITARGTRITVRLDGRPVASVQHFGAIHGAIGLRFTGGNPIEFRNLRLKPLDMACLFDGEALKDWRTESGNWTLEDRAATAAAPGTLASARAWDDFVLQADVRANGDPGAALLFRGEAGVPGSGYEVRLPAGALIDVESSAPAPPAREWITATLIAQGRRINLWIDGHPVLSWRDPRPEGLDVRKGEARLRRGLLRLRGAGGSVFRDLCIAPLARR